MTTPFVCQRCVARLRPISRHTAQHQELSTLTRAHDSKSAAKSSDPKFQYRPRPSKWRSILHPDKDTPVVAKNLSAGDSTNDASWRDVHEHNRDTTLFYKRFGPNHAGSQKASTYTNPSKNRTWSNHNINGQVLTIAGHYGFHHTVTRQSMHQARRVRALLNSSLRDENILSRPDLNSHMEDFLSWKRAFGYVLQTLNPDVTAQVAVLGSPNSASVSDLSWKAEWESASQGIGGPSALWPGFAERLLRSSLEDLFSFTDVAFAPDVGCPSYIIEDTLYLMSRKMDQVDKTEQQRLLDVILSILRRYTDEHLCLDQHVLFKISKLTPPADLVPMCHQLLEKEHPDFPINKHTLLQFASRLSSNTQYKTHATEIICLLTQRPKFDINSPASTSVCTTILTLPKDTPPASEEAEPDRLLKVLMDHGLRPNLINLTSLMQNFRLRGRLDTAWRMLDLLQHYGIQPDSHVFAILMKGCADAGDLDSIRRLIGLISARNGWNRYVVNEILSMLARSFEHQSERRRRQLKDRSAWRPMLQLYSRFYKLKPLQKLTRFPLENAINARNKSSGDVSSITDLTYALPQLPQHKLLAPDNHTLILMLSAHIRSIQNPLWVYRYFTFFRDLLAKDDRRMMSLVETHGSYLFDIFLRAFMQFRPSIPKAMRIKNRMLEPQTTRTKETRNWPMPSLYTWTILANGFRNHSNPTGAVGMLSMMMGNSDFAPNQATWNVVVGAFARVGDIKGAVTAMRQMEQAGFVSNDKTLRAFQTLRRVQREEAIGLLQAYRKGDDKAKAIAGGDHVTTIQGLQRYVRDTHGKQGVRVGASQVHTSKMTLYERRKHSRERRMKAMTKTKTKGGDNKSKLTTTTRRILPPPPSPPSTRSRGAVRVNPHRRRRWESKKKSAQRVIA